MNTFFRTLAFVSTHIAAVSLSAASAPLPTPVRPVTFPLTRPSSSGTVVAWGWNGYSQTSVPTGLDNVIALAGGGRHSVALLVDGHLVPWGWDEYAQAAIPAEATNVVAIAEGNGHDLALRADGTIVSWGYPGDGRTIVPSGLASVVSVAAAGGHSVALKSNGTVVAWGFNSHGQADVPAGLSNVVAIAAGYYHTVALKDDGTLVTWGKDCTVPNTPPATNGVVNPPPGAVFPFPFPPYPYPPYVPTSTGNSIPPAGLSNVVAIAAGGGVEGGGHTLALKSDGTVVAFGNNDRGQLNVPANLNGVVAVAAGFYHSLALRNNGDVIAWGDNSYGQTNVSDAAYPSLALAAGSYHSLALKGVPPRTGSATVEIADGAIVQINVTDAGQGYLTVPTITISGGGGSGATAVATIANGSITGITIVNAGAGYTSAPQVYIESPNFKASVVIEVSRVNVRMHVVPGKKYRVESSDNFIAWTPASDPFVATSENMMQEFVIAETGRFFRMVEVP